LVRNTRVLGESASSILRRLLSLPIPLLKDSDASSTLSPSAQNGDAPDSADMLLSFVISPQYRGQRNVTEKFLALLGFLYQQHQSEFEKVRGLAGRRRAYFGRSESEITRSGSHTYPREIPQSPYWVLTNASNHHKREIVQRALQQLGYSSNVRTTVAGSLE